MRTRRTYNDFFFTFACESAERFQRFRLATAGRTFLLYNVV